MKKIICKLCKKEFDYIIEIEGKKIVANNRKYCWDCSPAKTHNTRKLETVNLDLEISKFKICSICSKTCSENEVTPSRWKQNKNHLKTICKNCATKASIKKEQILKNQLIDYKGGICQICNQSFLSAVFDFHHIEGKKEFTISSRRKLNFNKLKLELDKCILICSNCHRQLHWKENLLDREIFSEPNLENKLTKYCSLCKQHLPKEYFFKGRWDKKVKSTYCKKCCEFKHHLFARNNKIKAVEYKGGKCQMCGFNSHVAALDFHHLNPEEKEFRISKKIDSPWKTLVQELDKCILLCSNCHRKIHHDLTT